MWSDILLCKLPDTFFELNNIHTKNAGFKVKCRHTQKYRHLSEQNKQVCGIEENRKDFSKSAKPKTPQLPT
jgi:hypothetical protein